jgi:signal peptidase I
MDHRDPPGTGDGPPAPLWPTAGGGRTPEGRARRFGDRPAEEPHHRDRTATSRGLGDGYATGSADGEVAGASIDEHREGGQGQPRRRRRSDDTRDRSGGGASAFLRELPILILVAFVLAFLLRTFVVQVFFIPSSSMEPTLQVDDRMVVEKITFRFREPRRGDVVVFEEEGESLVSPTRSDQILRGIGQFLGLVPVDARDFVKRVIAVGGDEVWIDAGQVYVNDVPLEEPYVVFPDNDDYGPVTVPDEHLFFLGDNRPNSSDSRRSLGFVPADAVVGRAVVIIWPLEHWNSLTGVTHEVEEATGAPEGPRAADRAPGLALPSGDRRR